MFRGFTAVAKQYSPGRKVQTLLSSEALSGQQRLTKTFSKRNIKRLTIEGWLLPLLVHLLCESPDAFTDQPPPVSLHQEQWLTALPEHRPPFPTLRCSRRPSPVLPPLQGQQHGQLPFAVAFALQCGLPGLQQLSGFGKPWPFYGPYVSQVAARTRLW